MPERGAAAAFWEFSLALYAVPGVAPLCLELQDRHGIDVNLLLLSWWLGASGRGRLTPAALAAVEGAVGPYRRATLAPLRAARRALAGAPAPYAEAKRRELAAERAAQRLMVEALPELLRAAGEPVAAAAANLRFYLDANGVPEISSGTLIELFRAVGVCHRHELELPYCGIRHHWRGPMSLQDRIETLRARHASLESEIGKESCRPLPNPETVSDLKRQKLRIKDELFELERQH